MDLLHNSFFGLNKDETAVWAQIRFKMGKDNAISGRTIEASTGLSYKRVQKIISDLVNKHGKFVGSCTKGFYVPGTSKELHDATRTLRHRGILTFFRASRLEKISPYELFKRSMIEFKDEMAV